MRPTAFSEYPTKCSKICLSNELQSEQTKLI